jgi:hypothetical protein
MLAPFVDDLLTNSGIRWQSITITPQEKSEEFCVSIATNMSLEDIEKNIQYYYEQHWIT